MRCDPLVAACVITIGITHVVKGMGCMILLVAAICAFFVVLCVIEFCLIVMGCDSYIAAAVVTIGVTRGIKAMRGKVYSIAAY